MTPTQPSTGWQELSQRIESIVGTARPGDRQLVESLLKEIGPFVRRAPESPGWQERAARLRIVAAAVIHGGVVHTAPHHHLAMWQISCCWGEKAYGPQGFVASDGRFYHRVQAKVIAQAAGQIKHPLPHQTDELYSEELWSYADWLKEHKMGDHPDAAKHAPAAQTGQGAARHLTDSEWADRLRLAMIRDYPEDMDTIRFVLKASDAEVFAEARKLRDARRVVEEIHEAAERARALATPHTGQTWCAMCGKMTDHGSGSCPELKGQPPHSINNPEFIRQCGPQGAADAQ